MTATAEGRRRYAAALHRRRAAADDMRPLASGHRDPWQPYRGRCGAYRQAAQHLDDRGLLPAPPVDLDDLRAMWRDEATRALATEIATAWELTG